MRARLDRALDITSTVFQEADVLSALEEDALQGHIERVWDVLHEDLNRAAHPRAKLAQGGHHRTVILCRLIQRHLGLEEAQVRVREPRVLVGERRDEGDRAAELQARDGVDRDTTREPLRDLTQRRLVQAHLCHHLTRRRDADDLLTLAHLSAELDGLAAAPAVSLVPSIDDHAGRGSAEDALLDLVLELVELLSLERELSLSCLELDLVVNDLCPGLLLHTLDLSLRLFEVLLELHLLLRVLVLNEEQLGPVGLCERDLCALERELVPLELGGRQEALFGELLRPPVLLSRLLELTLRHLDALVSLLLLLLLLGLSELCEVDLSERHLRLSFGDLALVVELLDLEVLTRLGEGRLGRLNRDLLLYDPVDLIGRVELTDDLARLNERALCHHREDRRATLDLTLDASGVLG